MKRLFSIAAALLFCTAGATTTPESETKKGDAPTCITFSKFERLSKEPILSPRPGKFDSAGAFNPAATLLANGHTVLLYRGQDEKGISRIGYAESEDGINFTADDQPVIAPQLSTNQNSRDDSDGVEDARLTRDFGGKNWLATATVYSKASDAAQLVSYVSSGKNLRQWQRKSVIMPANQGKWNIHWTKSGAIVVDAKARPLKINKEYYVYYMGDAKSGADQMGVASSPEGIFWQDKTDEPVLPRRPGMFDSRVVEPGPHPIITDDGILLLYNGGDDSLTYKTGWALFDKNDPTKLLARCSEPIFSPELSWEKKNASNTVHQVPNVVFVEGIVPERKDGKVIKDSYLVYYGSADSYVGVARTRLIRPL